MSTAELEEHASLDLLATAPVARLVVSVADVIDIYPVTATVFGGDILFRTAPGSKLAGLAANASVLVEADEFGPRMSWSVVVRGLARRIEDRDELEAIEPILREPFAGGRKEVVVRVTPTSVSGRLIERAPLDTDVVLDPPD